MSTPPEIQDIGLDNVRRRRALPPEDAVLLEAEHDDARRSWRRTWAMRVPGGWIVYCLVVGVMGGPALTSTFVSDPSHSWFSNCNVAPQRAE
jgi:hypothetical protein